MLQPSLSPSVGSASLVGFQPLCPAAGGVGAEAAGVACPAAPDFADMMSDLAADIPVPRAPAPDLSSAVLAAGLIAGLPVAPIPAALEDLSVLDDGAIPADADGEPGDDPIEPGESPVDEWSDPAGVESSGLGPELVGSARELGGQAAVHRSFERVFAPRPSDLAKEAAPAAEVIAAPVTIGSGSRPSGEVGDSIPAPPPAPRPAWDEGEPSEEITAGDGAMAPEPLSRKVPAQVSAADVAVVSFPAVREPTRRSMVLDRTPVTSGPIARSERVSVSSATMGEGEIRTRAEPAAAPLAPAVPASPLPGMSIASPETKAGETTPAPIAPEVRESGPETPAAFRGLRIEREPTNEARPRGVDEAEVASVASALGAPVPSLPERSGRRGASTATPPAQPSMLGLENFAGRFRATEINAGNQNYITDKNGVTVEGEGFEDVSVSVGIGVAKFSSAMPYAANFPAPAPAFGELASSGAAPLQATVSASESAGAPEVLPPPPAVTTVRAVEVVLDAAHAAAGARRSTVELEFSVGGTALQVRVELRQDEVQATFRTESPELQHALSHEWESVVTAAAAAERGVRLLPAIFASAATNQDSGQNAAFSFAGGDQSAAQRDAQARRGEGARPGHLARRATAIGAAAVLPAAGSIATRTALPTSRHLHTLA